MAHDISQTQVIKGAKFYYLRRILHDYPDLQGIQILKHPRAAMAHDPQILIVEMVLPETKVPWQATLADLSLISLGGRKGALKKAVGKLAEQSGLHVAEIHTYDHSDNFSVIVMLPF